jgi:hypothetical protein
MREVRCVREAGYLEPLKSLFDPCSKDCDSKLVPRRNLEFWRRVQRENMQQVILLWRRGNTYLIISPPASNGLMDHIDAYILATNRIKSPQTG